jgi:hypothetical protein
MQRDFRNYIVFASMLLSSCVATTQSVEHEVEPISSRTTHSEDILIGAMVGAAVGGEGEDREAPVDKRKSANEGTVGAAALGLLIGRLFFDQSINPDGDEAIEMPAEVFDMPPQEMSQLPDAPDLSEPAKGGENYASSKGQDHFISKRFEQNDHSQDVDGIDVNVTLQRDASEGQVMIHGDIPNYSGRLSDDANMTSGGKTSETSEERVSIAPVISGDENVVIVAGNVMTSASGAGSCATNVIGKIGTGVCGGNNISVENGHETTNRNESELEVQKFEDSNQTTNEPRLNVVGEKSLNNVDRSINEDAPVEGEPELGVDENAQQSDSTSKSLPSGEENVNSQGGRLEPDPARLKERALSAVDRVLKSMIDGNIAFIAPKEMDVGDTGRVKLTLSVQKSVDDLKDQLLSEVNPSNASVVEGVSVKVYDLMVADLKGADFKIEAASPKQQAISEIADTNWIWDVQPSKSGDLRMVLTLSVVVSIHNIVSPRVVKQYEKVILVKVSPVRQVVGFLSDNWQWGFGSVFIPLGVWLFRGRKKRGQ